MASIDDELLLDEQENRRELDYIKSHLSSEIRPHFSDDDIYYLMDAIVDYYYTSGVLESADDEVELDLQQVADAVAAQAKKDGQGTFDPQEVFFVVQADLDFQEEEVGE
jgi:hypothetical protein